MGVKTVHEYTCDRCGHVSKDGVDSNGTESGNCFVKYNGNQGSKAWDGAWGGTGFSGDTWLCRECTKKFRAFMAGDGES